MTHLKTFSNQFFNWNLHHFVLCYLQKFYCTHNTPDFFHVLALQSSALLVFCVLFTVFQYMGEFFPISETETTNLEVHMAIGFMVSFVGTCGFLKNFARCGLVFVSQMFCTLIASTRILNFMCINPSNAINFICF